MKKIAFFAIALLGLISTPSQALPILDKITLPLPAFMGKDPVKLAGTACAIWMGIVYAHDAHYEWINKNQRKMTPGLKKTYAALITVPLYLACSSLNNINGSSFLYDWLARYGIPVKVGKIGVGIVDALLVFLSGFGFKVCLE